MNPKLGLAGGCSGKSAPVIALIAWSIVRILCGITFGVSGHTYAQVSPSGSSLSNESNWIADSKGCRVWNPVPTPNETIIWSGTCQNGFAEGEGTVEWFQSGKSRGAYTGVLQQGKPVGSVVATYPNGQRYEGGFSNGRRNGKGTIFFPNGDRLDGEFREGRLFGDGIMTRQSGQKIILIDRDGKVVRADDGATSLPAGKPQVATPSDVQVDSSGRSGTSQPSNSSGDSWRLDIRFGDEMFPSFIVATATAKRPLPRNFFGDPLGSVSVEINNSVPGAKIRLVVDLDTIAERTIFEETLPDIGVYRISPKLRYRYQALQNLAQPTTANLVVSVSLNGTDVGTKSSTVRIRSINDVPFAHKTNRGDVQKMEWMFAAFVNENHPWIDPLLREALATRKAAQFVGYQGGTQDVFRQVEAIWTALQRRKITYSSITTTSDSSDKVFSQHVRFLSDSVRNQQANCVDGVVLLASILRKIGIEPFMVFVPGHAYLGFYVDAGRKSAAFVETTMIGRGSFQQALAAGEQNHQKYASLLSARDPRTARIDISAARKFGVMPISR